MISCKENRTGPVPVVGYLACVKNCTLDPGCHLVPLKAVDFGLGGEAYEFIGYTKDDRAEGSCTTKSNCDGAYSEDDNENRRVGYCLRIDHFPNITVKGVLWALVNVGVPFEEGRPAIFLPSRGRLSR